MSARWLWSWAPGPPSACWVHPRPPAEEPRVTLKVPADASPKWPGQVQQGTRSEGSRPLPRQGRWEAQRGGGGGNGGDKGGGGAGEERG